MDKENYGDFPRCPHCGSEEHDAWEINFGPGLDGDAEVTCNSCGGEYFCSREVSVSYRSLPLKENRDE